ncbi:MULTISPECIES: hypothetical protein [Photobacterium]|uniref:Uncharacterized protein n=1 Tax=Photobacterium iliopiscarium TaxID=56192 RepID=A0A2T3MQB3_9GAMM|nr:MULTISPECIES: hypothetical protein [Photobacterium]MCD9480653.1 hypothetical protein [Photobacterium phosphoreum]PSV99139.1 hypothetical protein C9I88_02870 [Photobacterium iliopiscarium]
MKYIFIAALLALSVVFGTGVIFYINVGIESPISTKSGDWAAFGSYFGGVAGALLSFLSVLLLIGTVRLQASQIKQSAEDAKNIEFLNLVTRADTEIEQWLKIRPAKHKFEGDVEFSLVVWGILEPNYLNPVELKPAFDRLVLLTEMYSAAIEQCYPSGLAVIAQHKRKCEELLVFLNKYRQEANSTRYNEIKAIEATLRKLI